MNCKHCGEPIEETKAPKIDIEYENNPVNLRGEKYIGHSFEKLVPSKKYGRGFITRIVPVLMVYEAEATS